MKVRMLIAAMVAGLLVPGAVNAQSAPPVPEAKPQPATPVAEVKPDFSPMAMFTGTWNCKRLKAPNGLGVGKIFTSTTRMTMDGRWMETDSTTPPLDATRTRNTVSKTWLTYDKDTKMWVTLGIDNFGGYGVSMSAGWNGGTLITKDKVSSNGQPLGVDTLTRISDTSFRDAYSYKTSKGKTEIFDNICTKGA